MKCSDKVVCSALKNAFNSKFEYGKSRINYRGQGPNKAAEIEYFLMHDRSKVYGSKVEEEVKTHIKEAETEIKNFLGEAKDFRELAKKDLKNKDVYNKAAEACEEFAAKDQRMVALLKSGNRPKILNAIVVGDKVKPRQDPGTDSFWSGMIGRVTKVSSDGTQLEVSFQGEDNKGRTAPSTSGHYTHFIKVNSSIACNAEFPIKPGAQVNIIQAFKDANMSPGFVKAEMIKALEMSGYKVHAEHNGLSVGDVAYVTKGGNKVTTIPASILAKGTCYFDNCACFPDGSNMPILKQVLPSDIYNKLQKKEIEWSRMENNWIPTKKA